MIVFDLDGTLCNIEHRLHFIKNKPKDWPAFYRACVNDVPVVPLIQLCQQLILAGNRIEVWSGRSDVVRAETERWLNQHAIGYALLRMRKEGDYRPDDVVKAEWLDSLLREDWPSVVFDDRTRMVRLWRSRGIVCCQVQDGDF